VLGNDAPLEGRDLTEAISAEMVDLYTRTYGHSRTSARTFINEDVVVCVLENILSSGEAELVAAGSNEQVIDGRVAFQTDTEDEFTEVVERLTGRAVVGFLSANQTSPEIASELFFLAPTTSSPAGA
jgi:uncharacterized protein YbcI